MSKTDLSIIVVNYNTRDLLKQCLESITGQGEIIVVDNGSTDDSAAMVEKEFPLVKLIKNKKNLGFARANNQGLEQARGKHVLFLNSDTIIPPETIPALINYLQAYPQVAVITPYLALRDGQLDPDCHRGFPTPWAAFCYLSGLEKIFPRSKIFGQYHQTWKNLKKTHQIDACCGAFLLARKKILDDIGGFDEDYFFYGEDLDLCYRIRQLAGGGRVVFYPGVKAVHYKGSSSGLRQESQDIARADKKTRLRVARASIKAMEIFYRKFYKDKYPKWLTGLVLFAIKIKGFFRISNIQTK